MRAAAATGCVCCLSALMIGIAIGLFGLSIAEIAIGAKYLHQCPIERMIPIYLIVAGVFGIASSFFQGERGKGMQSGQENKEDERKGVNCLSSLIGLFTFAWFIVGNVYVFRNYKQFHRAPVNATVVDPLYCAPLLMDFAFYSIIVHYILMGAMIVLMCLFCCCAIGKIASEYKQPDSE